MWARVASGTSGGVRLDSDCYQQSNHHDLAKRAILEKAEQDESRPESGTDRETETGHRVSAIPPGKPHEAEHSFTDPPRYQVRRIELREADLERTLLPKLRDRVFHVTTQEAWPSIAASGFVLVDPPEDVVKWPYDAYFRSICYISLCDLRSLAEDDLELGLERFPFLDPRRSSTGPVYLFLGRAATERIVTYREVVDRAHSLGKMIAPHIEGGYPGDLPLTAISDVLVVHVKRSPFFHPVLGYTWMDGHRDT